LAGELKMERKETGTNGTKPSNLIETMLPLSVDRNQQTPSTDNDASKI